MLTRKAGQAGDAPEMIALKIFGQGVSVRHNEHALGMLTDLQMSSVMSR